MPDYEIILFKDGSENSEVRLNLPQSVNLSPYKQSELSDEGASHTPQNKDLMDDDVLGRISVHASIANAEPGQRTITNEL